ncbi:unnamed protein product [Symbiodinium natans]|uniref:Uncharacterized protein n=1 Tax=Symbiodinium natans TaxID=878477 RepID=A0A812SHJ6_9DINO|nr:unnamed protein product [Symbiodinium natans]
MTLPYCFARVGVSAALLMMLAASACHTTLMLQEALVTLIYHGTPRRDYSDWARTSWLALYVAQPFCSVDTSAMAELAAYSGNCMINLGKALGAIGGNVTESTTILAGAALCVLLFFLLRHCLRLPGIGFMSGGHWLAGACCRTQPYCWDDLVLPSAGGALRFHTIGSHELLVCVDGNHSAGTCSSVDG